MKGSPRLALKIVSITLLIALGTTAALAATVPSVRVALGPVGAIVPGPAAQYDFRVDGPSMEPTYHDGQFVQLQPITAGGPQRCDVIAFRPPTSPQVVFLKRVIGVPNEHLTITASGVQGLAAQCNRYTEPLLNGQQADYPAQSMTLGAHDYYVLGDNRANSLDSREFGPVPLQNIVGFIPAT